MNTSAIDERRAKFEAIEREVASLFNLSPEELHKKSLQRAVVIPRQIAIYMARQMTNAPSPEIGKYFGIHHTTVLHSIDKIDQQRDTYKATDALIRRLSKSLKSRVTVR
jgi:chromosomal replication initiator protein